MMSTYLNREYPLNLQESFKIKVVGAQFGVHLPKEFKN